MNEHSKTALRRALGVALAAGAGLILAAGAGAEPRTGAPAGGHGGGHGGGPAPRGAPSAPRGAVTPGALSGHGAGGHLPTGAAQVTPGGVFRGYDGRDVTEGQAYGGDRRGFGHEYQAGARFHIGAYSRPGGWYAHHWAHGDILPALFWAQDFWLTDYWLYNLSPPPYGFVWVRDDGDALLVNTSTGEVEEVIYGAFY